MLDGSVTLLKRKERGKNIFNAKHLIIPLMFLLFLFSVSAECNETINEIPWQYKTIHCDVYLENITEMYIYGNNYTSYHWDYQYPTNPSLNDINLFHRNTTNEWGENCFNITKELINMTITRVCTPERDYGSAPISVTLFILAICVGLFALPYMVEFTRDEFSNLIIKRAFWILSIFLMMLNSATLADMAIDSGLAIERPLYRYMWLFGIAGVVFIMSLVIKTALDLLEMWNVKQKKERGEMD